MFNAVSKRVCYARGRSCSSPRIAPASAEAAAAQTWLCARLPAERVCKGVSVVAFGTHVVGVCVTRCRLVCTAGSREATISFFPSSSSSVILQTLLGKTCILNFPNDLKLLWDLIHMHKICSTSKKTQELCFKRKEKACFCQS